MNLMIEQNLDGIPSAVMQRVLLRRAMDRTRDNLRRAHITAEAMSAKFLRQSREYTRIVEAIIKDSQAPL